MSTSSEIVKILKKENDQKTEKQIKLDVSLLSDDDSPCIVENWLPTGCLALDAIMGGGMPQGRLVEISGEYSSGKTLIASQIVSIAQDAGMIAGYGDTEGAVSLDMMKMLGVNVDEMIYSAPDTVEEVFEFFDAVLDAKKKIDDNAGVLLVWDSVAASSAKYEQESEYGKATMGRHAQIISASMRKFIHKIRDHHAYILFLNQIRSKIGVMFGDSTTTPGGFAIPFYASIRIRLDLEAKLKAPNKKGKPRIVGMNTRAKCIKNKVAMPYKTALLPIYFGHGIDDAKSTFYYLVDNGGIEQRGAKYVMTVNNDNGADELTFSKKQFDKIFDENYDQIADLILDLDKDTGDISQASVEE